MATESNTLQTILAADFGAANTHVMLFDVVAETYRLVGFADAPTTIDPPYREASEGMRHALLELQTITGRTVLDDGARLIMPATNDGRGIDAFVATASAGPAVRTLLLGLLPDVSLASARRVAATNYLHVVESLSLGDRRGEDQRLDAVLAAQPELIVIAGGTDGGATDALIKLTETVALACQLMPTAARPRALFLGNKDLEPRLQEVLGRVAILSSAPNVQPELGHEQLGPAEVQLAILHEEMRREKIGGFAMLSHAAGGILPTAQAAGFFTRFLSKLPAGQRGALTVDVGSASTYVAAAWNGDLRLHVRPDLGVGINAAASLSEASEARVSAITRWVPFAVTTGAFRDFVYNKSVHPNTVPATVEDLHLEYALARHVLRTALRLARPSWPEHLPGPRPDLLPWLSLIVGSGAALAHTPRPGLAALVLLDALQPNGVTRLLLDPSQLTAALGATTRVNPLAVAQVYDSGAYLELGTAVSVSGPTRAGAVICQAKLADASGAEKQVELKSGTIEVLPLPLGQSGKLTLLPRPGYNAGFGAGRGRTVNVTGGAVGVILDGRGRPIAFPRAAEQRLAAVQQWVARMEGR